MSVFEYIGMIDLKTRDRLIREVGQLKEMQPVDAKKLRYVMDECLVNIINYYAIKGWAHKNAEVEVTRSESSVEFVFRNEIMQEDHTLLQKKLQAIEQDDSGSRTLLREILSKELNEDQKGAGLGLLIIRQKLDGKVRINLKDDNGCLKLELRVQLAVPKKEDL